MKLQKAFKGIVFEQKKIFFRVFFVLAVSIHGQPIKNKFTHFTERDGLPSNNITCIMQLKNFPYEIIKTDLSSGDTILLLCDGLPELKNENNIQFGYVRVKDSFRQAAEKQPEEIINHLKEEVSRWVNDKDPDDDVTFVVIKVR